MSVFLHQSPFTFLRVLLVGVGQVAQIEPYCSACDMQHRLCVSDKHQSCNQVYFRRALIGIQLTSHQRVSSDGVAVEGSEEPATSEPCPGPQHFLLSTPRACPVWSKLGILVPMVGGSKTWIWAWLQLEMDRVVVFTLSLLLCPFKLSIVDCQLLPAVINTWPFVNANYKGTQSAISTQCCLPLASCRHLGLYAYSFLFP